ncbi:subtilisin-like protease SBT1.2, partial [Tanacetum coccineum]
IVHSSSVAGVDSSVLLALTGSIVRIGVTCSTDGLGLCELDASSCNDKIIGARSLSIVAMALNVNMKVELPLDDSGPGTHTASTTAGMFVKKAQAFGGADGGIDFGMALLPMMQMSNTRKKLCSILLESAQWSLKNSQATRTQVNFIMLTSALFSLTCDTVKVPKL